MGAWGFCLFPVHPLLPPGLWTLDWPCTRLSLSVFRPSLPLLRLCFLQAILHSLAPSIFLNPHHLLPHLCPSSPWPAWKARILRWPLAIILLQWQPAFPALSCRCSALSYFLFTSVHVAVLPSSRLSFNERLSEPRRTNVFLSLTTAS